MCKIFFKNLLTNDIESAIIIYRKGQQGAEPKGHKQKEVLIMYRVFRVFRDNEGKIFHKVPVGGAKTERGARALVAGQRGECIIVKI